MSVCLSHNVSVCFFFRSVYFMGTDIVIIENVLRSIKLHGSKINPCSSVRLTNCMEGFVLLFWLSPSSVNLLSVFVFHFCGIVSSLRDAMVVKVFCSEGQSGMLRSHDVITLVFDK